MVGRFWGGLVGGTYVGHSETYAADRNPDYSWLGQGGRLQGSSAPRLAFLKRIMEEGPVPGIDPIQHLWNYHLGGRADAYYLHYFGSAAPRSEEHTSELQSLMRNSYAVFCLKK